MMRGQKNIKLFITVITAAGPWTSQFNPISPFNICASKYVTTIHPVTAPLAVDLP